MFFLSIILNSKKKGNDFMAELNREIKDFGEHIGGAKKEWFVGRNVNLDDVSKFDDTDVKNFVNKSKVWKTPKWEDLGAEGYDKTAIYFIKLMRDAFPTKPNNFTVEEGKKYTELLENYRDRLMKVKTRDDVIDFTIDTLKDLNLLRDTNLGYYKPFDYYRDAMSKTVLMSYNSLTKKAMEKDFLYTAEEKFKYAMKIVNLDDYNQFTSLELNHNGRVQLGYKTDMYSTTYAYSSDTSLMEKSKENRFALIYDNKVFNLYATRELVVDTINKLWEEVDKQTNETREPKKEEETSSKRKKRFVIEPLKNVLHHSPFGDVKNVEGQNFLDDFGIRGGEFGNWLNDDDRQQNMNAAHDAFRDLAIALDISDTDIGLGDRLNIAFGARGSGSALAHYEPDREVINLTKMKGAGSLAHEFFHSLDNIIAKNEGIKQTSWGEQYATANTRTEKDTLGAKFPALVKLYDVIHNAPMTKKDLDELLEEKIQEITDKLNKDIRGLVWRNKENLSNPDAYDRYINYCQSLYEKALNGEELRTFEISRRGGKYIIDPEIVKTLKDFHKEIGEGANIERNVEYLIQQISNAASRISFHKEQVAKGDSVLTKDTDFYANAKMMDIRYTKQGHGYWQSDIELAARAFACYVEDKLAEKGMRNDYLCRPTPTAYTNNPSIPYGDERRRINQAFDEVIAELKNKNILHQRDVSLEKVEPFKVNDLTYTIAIRNNEVTVANAETHQYEREIFDNIDDAFDRYNQLVDDNVVRYEIDTYGGIQYHENGAVDFIVVPNESVIRDVINQTEYYGSLEHTVYEMCLIKESDGSLGLGYVKLAEILEDGSLGDPFYPEVENITIPVTNADRDMFNDYLSQEMSKDNISFDDEER